MSNRSFEPRPRHAGKKAEREQLVDAYQRAGLRGPIDAALNDPALSMCLENIVASNQADPNRSYDLAAYGTTVVITPVGRPAWTGVDTGRADRKRMAAGDQDD